jgi:heterodisulfide reductase subunit A
MAVEQLRWVQPRSAERAEPTQRALVLGGDVAAMHAALALAGRGIETHLAAPDGAFVGPDALVEAIQSDARITCTVNSQVMAHNGRPGRLHTRLQTPDGEIGIEHGALIVATGAVAHPGDGTAMTQPQLTERLAGGEKPPASVVMVQCAGDPAFCSKTCCEEALRNALIIKEMSPETDVNVVYRDIITPGFREKLYQAARSAGVHFLRHPADERPTIEGSTVTVFDEVLGESLTLNANWVALSTGVMPGEGLPALADALSLPLTEEGFFAPLNAQSAVLDTKRPGVYLAGLAGGPAFPEELIEQGQAAGLRAALFLRRPLHAPETVATVNERICSGCGLCVSVCPYDARTLDIEAGIAVVDPLLCEGCGTCVAVCPNGASGQVLLEARGLLNALDEALA